MSEVPIPVPIPIPAPTYKSASLVFRRSLPDHYPQYLLCKEVRNKKSPPIYHPIGGKVEAYDKNILETACREFVEETRLLHLPEYLALASFCIKCPDDVTDNKKSAIEHIYEAVEPYATYIDYSVCPAKNYLHRYYIVDLHLIPDDGPYVDLKEFLHNIGDFYKIQNEIEEAVQKERERDAGKIISLKWDSGITHPKMKRSKYSTLCHFFVSGLHQRDGCIKIKK